MGGASEVEQVAVELLERLRTDLGERMGTDEGDDVDLHVAGIAGQGLPADREREDCVEPDVEPLLDGDPLQQPWLLPGVAGVLELAHGGVELTLGRTADVPAVAAAVELAAHGDAGVPAAVGVLVLRR